MANTPKPQNTLDTTLSVSTRGDDGGERRAYDGPQPGDKVGRYLLSRELGAGGMGVVMAAYDPKLDRTVALKLLRLGSDVAVQRLIREAQALAMLNHPGVITVFEVGEMDGQHFISMEYVEGRTLKRWIAQTRPGWRRILEILLQAGRGLAAAHEVGLVHRDMKPGNVLVADDGRARVVDFGIATPRTLGHSGDSLQNSGDPDASPQDSVEAPVVEGLTEVGQVVGTPAYMSPEQHRGETVDARCDQFSFCVTAFECLFERRPFHATSLRGIARRKFRGDIEPMPRDTGVPQRIREAILRGLRADPDDRWSSMNELLANLDPPKKGRPVLWIAGLGIGAIALSSTVILGREDPKTRCDAGATEIESSWNGARLEALEQSFLATELAYAPDAAARVQGWLDRYAEGWQSKHAALCEAAYGDEQLAEADFDLQMACLRRRFSEFDAMVDVLVHADHEIVRDGIQAAASLRPVSECENLPALRTEGSIPTDAASEALWKPLLQRLAHARAMGEAGKFSDGLVQAESVLAELPDSSPAEIRVRAGLLVGGLAAKSADFPHAESVLTTAYYAAVAAGQDRLAATTAGNLAYVVGYRLAHFDDGLRWARYAEAAAQRSDLEPLAAATVRSNVAAIYFAKGDYELAAVGLEAALGLRSEHLQLDHPQVAVSLFNLAGLRIQQGKFEEAKPRIERALEIWEAQLGPKHPLVASALVSLAAIHEGQEQYQAAVPLLLRALEVREAEHGADHPDVGSAMDSLASVLLYSGQYEDAEKYARKGKEIRFNALPDPHPHRAASLTNLGMALGKLGRNAEAKLTLTEAIDMWHRTVGESHPHAAFPMTALGEVLTEEGEFKEAVELLKKAAKLRAEGSVAQSLRDETDRVLEAARKGLSEQKAAEESALLDAGE